LLHRDGNRDNCRGGADVPNDCQHVLSIEQLAHVRRGAGRFVAIVQRDESKLTATDAASAIGAVESHEDPVPHFPAQCRHRAAERSGHAENDFRRRLRIDSGGSQCYSEGQQSQGQEQDRTRLAAQNLLGLFCGHIIREISPVSGKAIPGLSHPCSEFSINIRVVKWEI